MLLLRVEFHYYHLLQQDLRDGPIRLLYRLANYFVRINQKYLVKKSAFILLMQVKSLHQHLTKHVMLMAIMAHMLLILVIHI